MKLEELQKLRDEVKAFTESAVHELFVRNTKTDIDLVSERILDDDITNLSDLTNLLDLKGQRKVLRANLTLFEDTVSTLDNRIENLLKADKQSETQQETTEENEQVS